MSWVGSDSWRGSDAWAAHTLLPPAGLTVTGVGATRYDLSWVAASGATGYDIERDGTVIVTNHATTSYSDTGRPAGQAHRYRVRSRKPG